MTNLTALTISTDQQNDQEYKCRICIVYFELYFNKSKKHLKVSPKKFNNSETTPTFNFGTALPAESIAGQATHLLKRTSCAPPPPPPSPSPPPPPPPALLLLLLPPLLLLQLLLLLLYKAATLSAPGVLSVLSLGDFIGIYLPKPEFPNHATDPFGKS